MDKLNFELPPPSSRWGTLNTKYQKDGSLVANNQFTDGTKNVITDIRGVIQKRLGGIAYDTVEDADGPARDLHEIIFDTGTRHLLKIVADKLKATPGDHTFTTITSGYSTAGYFEFADFLNRCYFSDGFSAPQVYDIVTTYGDVNYSFTLGKTKQMGAIAPVSAPTAGSPTAGGSVPDGAHRYKVTFLYYDFEESNGSPVSGAQTAAAGNNTIPLTAIPVGGYGVTARKVYRDDNDGVFVLITTIDNNTATTYSDTSAAGTLPIPEFNDLPPQFSKIVAYLSRLWVAGVAGDPSTLFFSNPGEPDIFDPENFIFCKTGDIIVGLLNFNDKLFVFNQNSVGQVTGNTSDTFAYSELPNAPGCSDNRSIRIRVYEGVPKVIWLSEKGIYATDGNNVEYISDAIEPTVQFNIQQASVAQGRNSQTTQVDFEAGTYTPGIDLESIPGTITTPNPFHEWADTDAWEEDDSVATNIATKGAANVFTVPTKHAPTLASGSNSGTVIVSNTIRTPLSTNYTGDNVGNGGASNSNNTYTIGSYPAGGEIVMFPYQPPRSGTLTSVTFVNIDGWNIGQTSVGAFAAQFRIYSDSSNQPGSIIYSENLPGTSGSTWLYSGTTSGLSVGMTGGTRYWIGIQFTNYKVASLKIGWNTFVARPTGQLFDSTNQYFNGGTWHTMTLSGGGLTFNTMIAHSTAFVSTAIPTAGTWTGPIYDSLSVDPISATIAHTGTFPAGTTSVTSIQMSDDVTMTTGVTTETEANLNGSAALSLSGNRYWRIKVDLTTTDDRNTAQIGPPTLRYDTTGTWISAPIDHTTDIVSLDSLVLTATTPAGTTAAVTIATSDDDIAYSSYTVVGSAVPKRYSKVKIVLTADTDDALTATAINLLLTWSLESNLISSVIDTAVTPSGWGVFLASYLEFGGEVAMKMRSSSTLTDVAATGTITILDYTSLSGIIVTIDGTPLTEGVDWTAAVSNNATADSLAAAIDALPDVDAPNPAAAIITITATVAGAAGNAITMTTDGLAADILLSGATLTGGLDALENSTFYDVTTGEFPAVVPLNRYVQWQTLLTSHANQVPQVDAVTVNWVLTSGVSVRVCSLFYNKKYYLGVAGINSTYNNIVLELDQNGDWRYHEGVNANSFVLFFNQFYYADSTQGYVVNWFESATDIGDEPIVMDVRTKDFEFEDHKVLKIPRYLCVSGMNTGTTIHVYYSIDGGESFIEMVNQSGTTGLTTATDGAEFVHYFQPMQDGSAALAGRSILYRILSSDEFPCEIFKIEGEIFRRKGKLLTTVNNTLDA